MSPVIRIPDPIYSRLEGHAKGFDTPSNVIEKILDYYEKQHGISSPQDEEITAKAGIRELDPDNPGDLHFTKIINAEFGDTTFSGISWNRLVCAAHRIVLERVKTYDLLKGLTESSIVRGQRHDSGFHYVEDMDISITNVNANTAWRNALALAKQIKVSIKVKFRWSFNKRAAHPNEKGEISWAPV